MICCREGSGIALYIPIYDTPNSLLTESMVDRGTILGKELGPLIVL